jgi:hypothetical protein
VVRARYGRRGRSGDPEYGIKNLLVRDVEHLSPDQFAKVITTFDGNRHGQEIATAWIAKESSATPSTGGHASLALSRASARSATGSSASTTGAPRTMTSPNWCLARTVSRWEDEIVAAVITGITNATAESLNRLANLEARLAYGFRNPRNQQRRVRIACTRGCRRRSRTATIIRTRTVTGRKPRPG